MQAITQAKTLDAVPIGKSVARLGGLPEDVLLKKFLGVSIVMHIVVVFISGLSFFSVPPPVTDEWSMDADLITDMSPAPQAASALPNAVKAEEAKVQADLLPQITKTVTIKEQTKEEEAIAEKKEVTPEPPPDAKVADTANKVDATTVKSPVKDAPEVEEKELLKRRAIELLRLQNQTAKKNEAQNADAFAKVGQALSDPKNKDQVSLAGGSLAGKSQEKRYVTLLQKAVRQHYTLPEAYNLKGADTVVVIGLVVAATGEISQLEVKTPSKDPAFDALTLEAVRAAAPLPKPPESLVGKPFDFVFRPQ